MKSLSGAEFPDAYARMRQGSLAPSVSASYQANAGSRDPGEVQSLGAANLSAQNVAFSTRQVTGGRLLGMGAQTRGTFYGGSAIPQGG